MKSIRYLIAAVALGVALSSCENFLEYDPKGTVAGEQLTTPESVDGLVTAAYASLGNDHWIAPYTTLWPYGNVRADDAYKGGGGTGDVFEYNSIEQFVFVQPNFGPVDNLWYRLDVGISRANQALRGLEPLTEAQMPTKVSRQAEARFIRGHYNFLLKILFNRVPYIDETVPEAEYETISNVALTSDELWERIAADFRFAADNLPSVQHARGRVSRPAATAYLAKVELYRAYQKNDMHQVTGIDRARLQQVLDLTNEVISSGRYSLTDDFAENFLWETEANSEVVVAIMMSADDGTPNGRLEMGNGLNYNMAPGYGCCWFHIPSQNLINAFKTNANGLPQFDTYNQVSLTDSIHFWTNSVDPRIDHTVGIAGHPFKYDPIFIFQRSWARTPQVYGYHSSMKELQHPNSPSLRAVGPFWASSKDVVVIRYADVLLWRAEALIELGRHVEALPIINQIRARAANSTGRLEYADGSPVANYNVRPYSGAGWTKAYAREALRWERRLELAMEGYRFFDLVRWGIAEETLNQYLTVEKTRREFLREARLTAGRDEYLPIPQEQIDFSRGLYQQNPGY
jgi:starch-binding outer membrane protein, SusD/RagB family